MIDNNVELVKYYDELYKSGYMDEWEDAKKARIIEVLSEIKLHENSKILDFGCGTGVFSNLLKNHFPQCEVYGCEITEVALQIAKMKYTNCTFISNDELIKFNKHFDFVFSHHVLEHVDSIDETLGQINSICKENAVTLHILPCGNINSYEYNITKRVENGINENVENRFFYEDPGHLRRLTSERLINLNKRYSFRIKSAYFASQHYGAITWIAKSSIFNINSITNYKIANSNKNKLILLVQRFYLTLLYFVFFPPKYFFISWNAKPLKFKHIMFIGLFFIPFLLCYPIYKFYNDKAIREWTLNKDKENGSEMYLTFIRDL